MKALLLGCGEIGNGVLAMAHKSHAVMVHDPAKGYHADKYRLSGTKVLLVAIPWSDEFAKTVVEWRAQLPELEAIIIFSTVPVGVSSKLNAVHYPIEAKHPYIARDIRINQRGYLGGHNQIAELFLQTSGFHFVKLEKPEHTEFLKLRSTAIYGVNIEFARYTAEVCKELKLDYSVIKEYDENHNRLCRDRGTPEHARYILDAPDKEGIKGHCVLENAVILREQYPSPLIDQLLALGKHPDTIQGKPYLNKVWLACEHIGKGRTLKDIADQFNVTPENIGAIMRRRGLETRTNEWTDRQLELLHFLVDKLTFSEIATRIGKTRNAVACKAIQMGINSCYKPGEMTKDPEVRKKISATLQGIDLDDWEGFAESLNSLIRKSVEYQDWRAKVFERDNFTCQKCGTTGYVEAHHIKPFAEYPELRLDVSNGQTLCKECHGKEHWGGDE